MSKSPVNTFLISLVIAINLRPCKASSADENEVIEVSIKPHVVKYEVLGEPHVVKLKCSILKTSCKNNRIMSINELRWERKICGYGLNLTNCARFSSLTWTPVMCKNGSKFCDGYTLKLENLTSRDSGYYRCLYKNYMSKQFKVYKVFYLDVYDPQGSFEILDEPESFDNPVIHVNDTVTFRCRARSLSPLYMIWVKLATTTYNTKNRIQYGISTYELINSYGTHNVGNNLYISKLTLHNCQIPDDGLYYCIIINVNNAGLLKNKSMSLTVLPNVQSGGFTTRPTSIIYFMILLWFCFLDVTFVFHISKYET